jgi:hypothetical protein
MNVRVLIMLAGAAAALWSVSRWRTAVQYAMVLLIFEGAIRKWVFPGAQDLIYFAKDVLLLGAYVGYFRERPRMRHRMPSTPALYGLLSLAALLGILQIFNPNLPNLLVGVFGFKAYFFYAPLLFVLPAAFRDDAELYRFLRRYALIAIPIGVLATAQFFSPASSVLNTYARTTEESAYVATFGTSTFVRVTATFPFITGYTAYLLATVILTLTLLGVSGWRFRGNYLLFLALAMTLLGMLMSGSRGPVLMLVLLFPLYWWLGVIRERGRGATFGRLLVALSLVAAVVVFLGEDALGAFLGRATATSDVRSRVTSPLLSPYLLLPDAGVLGFGIGATHQTAAALAPNLPPYSWMRGLIVEVESGRILLEMGALGFLLIYFLRISMAVFALRQALTLRTRFHRALATASFLLFVVSLPGGVVFDVTSDVYYWFFAGLLMLSVRLDHEAVAAAARERARAAAAAAGQGTGPVATIPQGAA